MKQPLPSRARLLEMVKKEGAQTIATRLGVSTTYLHMLLGRASSPKSRRLPSLVVARVMEDTYGIPMRGWVSDEDAREQLERRSVGAA